jgi:ATP-dependent Clp protease adaptor protein ClpS
MSVISPEVDEELDVLVDTTKEYKLVVFNDDFNTFDFVIESLMSVCGHDAIQAEQCTLIIHFKGKCTVKEGEYSKLEPMCTALLERGITAEIQ